jgi:hypothetical protein
VPSNVPFVRPPLAPPRMPRPRHRPRRRSPASNPRELRPLLQRIARPLVARRKCTTRPRGRSSDQWEGRRHPTSRRPSPSLPTNRLTPVALAASTSLASTRSVISDRESPLRAMNRAPLRKPISFVARARLDRAMPATFFGAGCPEKTPRMEFSGGTVAPHVDRRCERGSLGAA